MKYSFSKDISERYEVKLENGDWADICIDENGNFLCNSILGKYSYRWTAFGGCFKSFLISLRLKYEYLLGKMCEKSYFDLEKWNKHCIERIGEMSKSYEIDVEMAREMVKEVKWIAEDSYTYMDAATRVEASEIFKKAFPCGVWDSCIYPDQDYRPQDVFFFKEVFPIFVEILSKEKKENNGDS